MKIECKYCGYPNHTNDLACHHCGAPVLEERNVGIIPVEDREIGISIEEPKVRDRNLWAAAQDVTTYDPKNYPKVDEIKRERIIKKKTNKSRHQDKQNRNVRWRLKEFLSKVVSNIVSFLTVPTITEEDAMNLYSLTGTFIRERLDKLADESKKLLKKNEELKEQIVKINAGPQSGKDLAMLFANYGDWSPITCKMCGRNVIKIAMTRDTTLYRCSSCDVTFRILDPNPVAKLTVIQ